MEGERKTNANITIEHIQHSTVRLCFRRDDNAKANGEANIEASGMWAEAANR